MTSILAALVAAILSLLGIHQPIAPATPQALQQPTTTAIITTTNQTAPQPVPKSFLPVIARLLDRPLAATRADCNDSRGQYSCGSSVVIYNGMIVKGADPLTFKYIDGGPVIGLDASHVYFGSNVIPNADPSTFFIVSPSVGTLAVDQHAVYFLVDINVPNKPDQMSVTRIPNSDPLTLVSDGAGRFHDKNQTYEIEEQRYGCGGDAQGCIASTQLKINGILFVP